MGNQQSSNVPVYYNADPTNEATSHALSKYIDLATNELGSKVLSTSDEFFAPATNLLKSGPAVKDSERMTDQGAWYDGWETRRHNKDHDWVIIKLAFPGCIAGFDVDTAHFNGNHPSFAAVDACYVTPEAEAKGDFKWAELLPKAPLGPSAHHLLALWKPSATVYNCVRLRIYPDGGVARFRVYGHVKPRWASISCEAELDLAFVGHGARAVNCSNEHFSNASHLILPGRGQTMKDGWETKRSRGANHCDWAVIKLGTTGYLEKVEIDTYQFKGNFPESASLQACYSLEENPDDDPDCFWFQILSKSALGAHQVHYFNLELANQPFTHVKLCIYPDGGVKRLRVHGRRCTEQELKLRLTASGQQSIAAPPLASIGEAVEAVAQAVTSEATDGIDFADATAQAAAAIASLDSAAPVTLGEVSVEEVIVTTTTTTAASGASMNGSIMPAKQSRPRDEDETEADVLRRPAESGTATLKRTKKHKNHSAKQLPKHA